LKLSNFFLPDMLLKNYMTQIRIPTESGILPF
jgi:hypothetical protein